MEATNTKLQQSRSSIPSALDQGSPPAEEKGAIGIAFLVWLFGGGLGLALLVFILLKVF